MWNKSDGKQEKRELPEKRKTKLCKQMPEQWIMKEAQMERSENT